MARLSRTRLVWVVAIGVRLAAAVGLVLYPRLTNSSLTGWDAERFHEIATTQGRPWADTPVEYPPGSVIAAQLIAADDPVGTNDRVVITSLVFDLGLAGLLRRRWGAKPSLAYLLLGVPLLPAGLLRFDLWAALAATAGLAALAVPQDRDTGRGQDARFAVAAVVGSLIKVWPILLVGVAVGVRRYRAAALAVSLGALAGLAWVAYGGTDAPGQVLSLRGTTGWHIESLPGSLIALTTDHPVRLSNNAYRIGTISRSVVLAGRLLVGSVLLVGVRRRIPPHRLMLAGTAALIVTAPLLSPQFLLWLTPFAALAWPDRSAKAAAAAIVVTGIVGPLFGYPNLADPVPAVLLLGRDALLAATVVLALRPNKARVGSDPMRGLLGLLGLVGLSGQGTR